MDLKALINKYENNGEKTEWLSLKDDGDSAMVRFLHSNESDLDVFEVHNFEVDGFNQSIKCLGEECVFCKEGHRPQLKMWLQMMDLEDDNKIKIWSRGVSDIKKILEEIAENGNLNERDYKIKRVGKKGSTKTQYLFYAKDKKEMELKERKKVEGYFVRVVTPEDMYSIINGTFTFKKDNVGTENNSSNESVF